MIEWFALPIALSIVALSVSKGWTDQEKLEKIFEKCKFDGMVIHRKTRFKWGTEYVYKIPLGLSFPEIERKYHTIQDGINNKRKGQQKHIELDYDGMLRVRVYEKSLPTFVAYVKENTNSFTLTIGEGFKGKVYHDFSISPHMIIAGTTRYGKTALIRLIITSLLHQCPDDCEFALFDLKGGLELGEFENVQQTLNLSVNVYESLLSLEKLKTSVSERLSIFRKLGYKNFNETKGEFKRVFIIVDEAAELSSSGFKGEEAKIRRQCELALAYIARVAGALGFHLVFCTQYPTFDVLPRQVKQNADAKVSFRLQTQTASEVVLDQSGAERLPHGVRGRALYLTDTLQEIQVPFVSDEIIKDVIKKNEQSYDERKAPRTDTDISGKDGLRFD